MRVKQFNPKFIAELLDAGFTINDEAYDRNMVFGQDYSRQVTIGKRNYYVILGIFQNYDIKNPYTVNAEAIPVEYKLNGQLVFDMFPSDGEECREHQRYVIGTIEVLKLIKHYTPLFLCQE